MKNLQKMGGLAALYEAGAYLVAMILLLIVMNYPSAIEPAQKMALVMNHYVTMYVMHFAVYVVFGIFLVILTLALYDRLKVSAPGIMQMAAVIGFIWAGLLIASGMIFNVGMAPAIALYAKDPNQATLLWLSIDSVSNGLSGNGEVIGGLWTVLISWAALRSGALPRILNYLGIVLGLAGILSVIPILNDLTGVFGMLQIVWFAGIGIILLRASQVSGAANPEDASTSIESNMQRMISPQSV